ncbi:MAG: hypothetical protein WA728_05870, partial [Xanthobacteraceae bacterium]
IHSVLIGETKYPFVEAVGFRFIRIEWIVNCCRIILICHRRLSRSNFDQRHVIGWIGDIVSRDPIHIEPGSGAGKVIDCNV